MLERVLGYADAVIEDLGPDIARAAEELEAFVELLASSEELRAVLGSPNVALPVRRSIVRQLMEGRVSAPVVAVLSYAVQGGAAANYQDDVAGAAAAAAAKRDGKVRLDEGPLGRSAAGERLDGYATAVLAGSDQGHLGEVEDELFRFMRTVDGNEELLAALTTAELPVAVREGIVGDLLSPRATAETARLARYAARVGRARDYLVLLDNLVQRVAREADRRVADVHTAVELSPGQEERLAAAISRYTGYQVEVRVTTEPELLGGFVAYVGDTVLDASLRQRIEQARKVFLSPPS